MAFIFLRLLQPFMSIQNDKIYINARFLMQRLTGVQRFAIEISKELRTRYGSRVVFIAPKGILHHDIGRELEVVSIGQFSGYFWEQIELPLFLRRQNKPLLLNLCNMAPVCYSNKIVTIHDLAYEDMSGNFSWKFRTVYRLLMPKIVRSSKKVLTVSVFSKGRLRRHYPYLDEQQIEIIPNGAKKWPPKEQKLPSDQPFILSVASSSMRKNLDLLILAFNKFNQINHGAYKLFLVGDKDRVFEKQRALQFSSDIISLGRVSDQELNNLYSSSSAFLNLSLYEGFGLPILEALSHHTPVVCSDIEVHKEIFEGAVFFVNPHDADAIANSLSIAVNDQSTKRRQRVDELLQNFTWERSALKIEEVIKNIQQFE